jgi:hypothetical protein
MSMTHFGDPATADHRLDESAYPGWRDRFSARNRRRMIDDDLKAGYSVPILLASVVSIGVMMAIITVLATW